MTLFISWDRFLFNMIIMLHLQPKLKILFENNENINLKLKIAIPILSF